MITKENLLSTEEIRKGIKGVLTLEEAQTRVDYGLGIVTMIDPVGRVFYFTDHRYMSTNVIGGRFCALLAKFRHWMKEKDLSSRLGVSEKVTLTP